jgi:pre-mRNA-splicing factor 38B
MPPVPVPGQVWAPPVATSRPQAPAVEARGKLVPTTANATYNLNSILASTISASEYFLSLLSEYESFESVLEVIRDECTHLDAFERGKAQMPSTAFCCMYKFFMMKLDVPQMNIMLRHKNVYVRGVALLYLRNIGEPSQLMGWCEPHLEDETMFTASSDSDRKISVGDWLLRLVTEQKVCGTVLRRIPVTVVKEFDRKGLEIQIKRERAEKKRRYIKKGLKCRAKWTDNNVYDCVVDEVLDNGMFRVTYTEYGNEEEIAVTDFEAASIPKDGAKDRKKRSRSRDKDRRRRSRSRDRDRRRRSRSRGRERDRRDRRKRSRSRSRSTDRKKRSESEASDQELSLEEEIELRLKKKRENERSSAVSSDGKYCNTIVSYKKSLSKQFKGGQTYETTNKKLDLPDAHPRGAYRSRDRDRDRDRRRRSPSPPMPKKKELTHAQKQKAAELLARYGEQRTKL